MSQRSLRDAIASNFTHWPKCYRLLIDGREWRRWRHVPVDERSCGKRCHAFRFEETKNCFRQKMYTFKWQQNSCLIKTTFFELPCQKFIFTDIISQNFKHFQTYSFFTNCTIWWRPFTRLSGYRSSDYSLIFGQLVVNNILNFETGPFFAWPWPGLHQEAGYQDTYIHRYLYRQDTI